uniref:DUF455-domain-containing protein n=1 Tax=Tetradesmus obliquus TaxID=3088 RepID=A0A383VR75_TETOB|eukprot:jgi/Sobl393_1/9107/SZX67272.1
MSAPEPGDTLVGAALKVLRVGDPWQKAEFTHRAVALWRSGDISQVSAGPAESAAAPDRPHRLDDKVKLVAPRDMPKLGKGGTLASRQALLHSLVHIESWAVDLSWDILAVSMTCAAAAAAGAAAAAAAAAILQHIESWAVDLFWDILAVSMTCAAAAAAGAAAAAASAATMQHIESWAVDLSWDIIARFGSDPSYQLPREFFDDFVQVAAEECSHFCSLAERLEAIGSHYGALPAHDGLWESASATAHSLPARLAVEHCVHEARGLDVLPGTVAKFRGNGDEETAALLWDVIYAEEISHCAAGVRWLKHLHKVATSHQPAAAAAAVTDASGPDQQLHQQQQPDALNSSSTAAAAAAAAGADWAADARKYDTVEAWFHSLIRSHFKGSLKPPFNEAARKMAGFGPEWYLPLSTEAAPPAAAAAVTAAAAEAKPEAAASAAAVL